MDLIITILPVVTKYLPISPRFTPYSTLTTRQPMVEFYLLTSPRFPLRKKNINPTLVRIELTTSALAGVQVTYYYVDHTGDELQTAGNKVHLVHFRRLPYSVYSSTAVQTACGIVARTATQPTRSTLRKLGIKDLPLLLTAGLSRPASVTTS